MSQDEIAFFDTLRSMRPGSVLEILASREIDHYDRIPPGWTYIRCETPETVLKVCRSQTFDAAFSIGRPLDSVRDAIHHALKPDGLLLIAP